MEVKLNHSPAMLTIDVKIKKLTPDAITPTYATDGSACFDLYAVESNFVDDIAHPSALVHTGIALEVPRGFQILVFSRSGHGFKNNVRLANCVGVIDSDYRGEIKVMLTADSEGSLQINKGDRVAQAQIVPNYRASFIEHEELTETSRGLGGFGSTGK